MTHAFQSTPNWEQTVDLVVKIPKGSISDIQQWVQIRNIHFYVYDSNEGCGTRSSDLLYYASVPLIRVLLSTARPLNVLLELTRPDCVRCDDYDRPELEVSLMDKTRDDWRFTRIYHESILNLK